MEFIFVKMKIYVFDACIYFLPLKPLFFFHIYIYIYIFCLLVMFYNSGKLSLFWC